MLREFLSANRAAIIERARAEIAARLAPCATQDELSTGIPLFLDQLVAILLEVTGGTPAPMGDGAAEHGAVLLRQGFTVTQVVFGYGGVGRAITKVATELSAPITADEFYVLKGCLDDAIARAITEYTRRREQTPADEGN